MAQIMDKVEKKRSFEFKRRIDTIVYRFRLCETIVGHYAWKREDADIWVTQLEGFGWICIDSDKRICAMPWGVAFDTVVDFPPEGEWVSKKGDKAYVYDLVYT